LVAVGVFASILLVQRYQAAQTPVNVEEETVKTTVVVLTRDLSLGDRIETGDVELASVPVEIAPRDVLSTLDAAVGKMVKTDMIQGEMVLLHNLADPTNNIGDISFILSEDHILMAFPANDLMSRNSMIQRGDIVDILATFDEEVETVGDTPAATDEENVPQTRTFTVDTMQRVSVTALVVDVIEASNTNTEQNMLDNTNQQTTAVNGTIEAYLFALSPQDALILKHLKDTNAIFDIVLRAPTSTMQFELTPVTAEYIIEFYGLEILP
ncbi:MAG: flagella basal body P-ring formation protein FlgA, partial [Anaerolineaceae bacterium]|nr:flagella basal body P-ring formation protein FlgA [Anaerolineaceae bacterium]